MTTDFFYKISTDNKLGYEVFEISPNGDNYERFKNVVKLYSEKGSFNKYELLAENKEENQMQKYKVTIEFKYQKKLETIQLGFGEIDINEVIKMLSSTIKDLKTNYNLMRDII